MKAILGVNFTVYLILGLDGIQNVFTRSRFQNILQNLHFANNDTAEDTDKAYKVPPPKTPFNNTFMETVSDCTTKQCLQLKPIKYGAKLFD